MLEKLFLEMISYYSGDPKRIQHFTKVHSYAKLIGEREQLSPEELYILEAWLLTHDIKRKEEAVRKASAGEGKVLRWHAGCLLMRLFAENMIERLLSGWTSPPTPAQIAETIRSLQRQGFH